MVCTCRVELVEWLRSWSGMGTPGLLRSLIVYKNGNTIKPCASAFSCFCFLYPVFRVQSLKSHLILLHLNPFQSSYSGRRYRLIVTTRTLLSLFSTPPLLVSGKIFSNICIYPKDFLSCSSRYLYAQTKVQVIRVQLHGRAHTSSLTRGIHSKASAKTFFA